MKCKSPDEIRAIFKREGVSVAQWCEAKNVSKATVYSLLAGNCKGNRGEAHRVAVLLGMKEAPTGELGL
jgi:gp16 family phage-associated protein